MGPCHHDCTLLSNNLTEDLSAKTIEGLSLTLDGINDIHDSTSLMASMIGVSNRVVDDILEEDLEHTTCLLVNETGDTLVTDKVGKTVDGGLGDALDIVAKDLAMTIGVSLS